MLGRARAGQVLRPRMGEKRILEGGTHVTMKFELLE